MKGGAGPPARSPDGRRRLRAALLIALVPGVIGIVFTYWPFTAGLERNGLDLLFLLRGPRPQPNDVCVVAIDDESYKAWDIDLISAWPRALHAELIRTLAREGVRAIAFDVLFEEPGDPGQDEALAEALAETGIVVLGSTVELVEDPRFRQARLVEPWEPFATAAAAVADVNLPTDRDGVIRSAWLTRGGRPSLALAAYEVATGDTSRRTAEARLIDYYGPPRTIPTVSLYQALEPETYLPPGFFEGRIAFVGLSQAAAPGPAAKDAFLTPYRGGRGTATFGVEIHATLATNLLEGRQIRLLPRWVEALALLLLPTLASMLFIYLRPVLGAGVLLALELLPWVTAYAAFTRQEIWLPVVIPAVVQLPLAYMMSLVWYYLTTVRDRERIRRAFSFYLSPAMISQITADPEALHLGGQEIVATALFSDIKGFTSIAERKTAPETAAMLNEYFSEITRGIFEADGTLIKYIGDAVFAIWGAPVWTEDHATRACRTALAMARSQERMAGTSAAELFTRIGVHTGPMLVGNLGSEQRFDYTAIGDAVNLAARLEGLNKAFGTSALASGDCFTRTDGSVIGRSLGRVRVVGRSEPVEIYELLALQGEPAAPDATSLEMFDSALQDFAAGDLDAAELKWREVLERSGGDDAPTRFYLDRLTRLRAAPLPPDWSGVIVFETK